VDIDLDGDKFFDHSASFLQAVIEEIHIYPFLAKCIRLGRRLVLCVVRFWTGEVLTRGRRGSIRVGFEGRENIKIH
jgi:hypothetical protein